MEDDTPTDTFSANLGDSKASKGRVKANIRNSPCKTMEWMGDFTTIAKISQYFPENTSGIPFFQTKFRKLISRRKEWLFVLIVAVDPNKCKLFLGKMLLRQTAFGPSDGKEVKDVFRRPGARVGVGSAR